MLALTAATAGQLGECDCSDWCGWAPGFDVNCYQALHCCACDECVARGVKPPKWWDRNNYYGDRSCLVWGVERSNDYGEIIFRTFCEVVRPICHGHDCNPPDRGHMDDNTFWCAYNDEPTFKEHDVEGRESWSQMLPDEWIETCCSREGEVASPTSPKRHRYCPAVAVPPSTELGRL